MKIVYAVLVLVIPVILGLSLSVTFMDEIPIYYDVLGMVLLACAAIYIVIGIFCKKLWKKRLFFGTALFWGIVGLCLAIYFNCYSNSSLENFVSGRTEYFLMDPRGVFFYNNKGYYNAEIKKFVFDHIPAIYKDGKD